MLQGCGAKTGLAPPGSRADASVFDAAASDGAGFDGGGSDRGGLVDPRAVDEWWFHTVRALCDSLAVEVCADGVTVAARFSANDLCDGANPTTAGSVPGRVTGVDGRAFVVELERDPETLFQSPLSFEFDASRDSLIWTDPPRDSFFWEPEGIRGSARMPPLDPDFVRCP